MRAWLAAICGAATTAGAAWAEPWRTAHKEAEGALGVQLSHMDRSNPNEPTASVVLVFRQNQGADYITQRVRMRCAEGQWQTLGGAAFSLDGTRLAAMPPPEGDIPWMPVAGSAGAVFHQAICQDVWAAEATVDVPTLEYARALRLELMASGG